MTAHSATLIDHVYTSQPDKVIECFVPNLALSDHYPVCFTRQTTKLQSTKRSHSSIKYRSFTRFDNADFLDELNMEIENFKCSQTDSNMNFATWNTLFLSVLMHQSFVAPAPRGRGIAGLLTFQFSKPC